MLQTYIESNLKFIDENRKHVFVVIEIVSNERTDEGKLRFAADHDETIFLPIENINPDLNVKDYTKELITIFEQASP
ncbi:hypothetical protein [Bacillus sp. JJ63]|uniref:hypothetical protein n=1 Tax=Bacillus sp. JJ63 TaxID=3122968 RepID=UPI003000EDE3